MLCKQKLISWRVSLQNSSAIRAFVNQANLKVKDDAVKRDPDWDTALPFSQIPGPTIPWLLKNFFLPGGKFKNLPRSEIFELMINEYGGKIMRVPGSFGRRDLIVVTGPKSTEKLFRNEGPWPYRMPLDTLVHYRTVKNPKAFRNVGGLLAEQNEEWSKFRSIVNPVMMQPRTVKIYIPKMGKVADEFIDKIKSIRDPTTNEVPGTFEKVINMWTLESVSVIALDAHLGLLRTNADNPDADKLIEALSEFFEISPLLDINPSIWKWIRTPKYYKLMSAFDTLSIISTKFINEALTRYEQEKSETDEIDKSVLERLLKINKDVAVVMAMDMLMAGVDTTSSAFVGCLLALAKNPDKQEKLRQEIKSILPDKNTPMTNENMNNLPYLRACIKEAMRCYPVVQGNMRKAGQDLALEGYQIPKGVDVVMMTNQMHKSEEYFEQSKKFIPERWLRSPAKEEDGCPVAGKPSNPFVYLPFGFGPRMCIGRRFVDMELELGLAKIVRNFTVEFNYSDDVFDLQLIYVPNKELKFKFTDIPE